MEAFAKGEIVVFPFPYTDLTNRKLRPCLVLSDEMGQDILLCQITSQKSAKDKFCVPITKKDTTKNALLTDSYIRCNMLFTADKSQIHKSICELKSNKYNEIVIKIIEVIKK